MVILPRLGPAGPRTADGWHSPSGASLIVAIASLAWTVYTDLKKRTTQPAAEVVARTVRVTRRDQGQPDAPDHVVEVVVTETIRAAADQEGAEG